MSAESEKLQAWAREAANGPDMNQSLADYLERFAHLVAADALERAAKEADAISMDYDDHRNTNMAGAARYVAGCIRALAAAERDGAS